MRSFRPRRVPSLLAFLFVLPSVSSAQICVGDCDGSREVRLGEVQTAFNIFLGLAAPNECNAADEDSNGEISLGEVQSAFNRFLSNCTGDPNLEEVRASSTTALSSVYGVVSFGQLGNQGGGGGGGGASVPGGGAGLASGCGLCSSGSADCSCDVDDFGVSLLQAFFTDCTFADELGNTVTKSGSVTAFVDDPDFCFGAPAFDVSYSLDFTNFVSSVVDSEGNFQVFQAQYAESFEAFGFGCFPSSIDALFFNTRGSGTREMNGTVRTVQGSFGFPAVDVTSDAQNLTIDVDLFEDELDCGVDALVNGVLTVSDSIAGTAFAQTFDDLSVVEILDGDTFLVGLEGSASTDCLGPVDLVTTEPLRIFSTESCPIGGRLQITLHNEGTTSAIVFDSSGGVGLDVGADGSIEEHRDSCVGDTLEQCGLEEPAGTCTPCSSGSECGSGLDCAPCFFCESGFDSRCVPVGDFTPCDNDVYGFLF